MTTASSEITLPVLELAAKQFAADRADLAAQVQNLNSAIEALKRSAVPLIKRRVNAAAESHAKLSALIDQARHLFVKPRTIVCHGIKLGLQKGKGGIDWDDDEKLIQLIKKNFSQDEADLLVKTTEKPIVSALEDLDVATLKWLGCRVLDTGDQVLIKPADSQVDKLVTALLKDALEIITER